MATPMHATRLFAAVAVFCAAGFSAALAQPNQPTISVGSPSLSRPEFTRPAGIPGSARAIATSDQYMIAPAQPVTTKKRKRP